MPVIANGTTSFTEQSKRAYVATGVFNTAFFSYTGTRDSNNIIQYALGSVTGATTANCVAGHVLKENGRKLVPGANPGVTNYMVGVFDSSSCLNGFIDPNNNLFAVYSTDLPNFIGRGVDTVTGPDGTTNDMGPPVYTNGTVTADGNITTIDGSVIAGKQIRSTTVTVLTPGATVNINASLGQVFTLAQGASTAVTITATASPPVGALVYLIVTQAGTAAAVSFGANTKGTTTTPTQNRTTTFAFVSDGTNLNMFSVATSSS
jgi:hypothetical protein